MPTPEQIQQNAREAMDINQGRIPMPVPSHIQGPQRDAVMLNAERAMAINTRNAGNLTEDELAEAWVKNIGGLDRTKPGISGVGLRSKMSLFGDTFDERKMVFEKTYPEGQYEEVPDTDIVLYRRTPEEQWAEADPDLFKAWANDFFMQEFRMDLADFAGDLPEVVGEAAGLAAFKKFGAGKFGGNLAKLAIGAMSGTVAQQGAQEAYGTQLQSPEEIAGMAMAEGGASMLGTTAGWVLGGTVNVARRKAAFETLRPGAREAMEAANRQGTPTIPMNQLSDTPFINRLGRQVSALWRSLRQAGTRVSEHSRNLMGAMVDTDARNRFLDESVKLSGIENRKIREVAEHTLGYLRKHPRERGRVLRELYSDWWESSGKAVDDAYRVARSVEEPEFVFDPAIEAAERLNRGIQTPGRIREEPVMDEAGKVVDTQELADMMNLRPVNSEIQGIVDDILELDPRFPFETPQGEVTEASVTDRITTLIQRADDAALPTPMGGDRRSQLQAKGLSAVLREMIDNPVNKNPDFKRAWDNARTMARDRFATREHGAIAEIARSEQQPSGVVEKLLKNRKSTVDDLIVVRRVVGEEGFEQIRSEYARTLFEAEKLAPGGMERAMNEMDSDVLLMLLPGKSRKAMKFAAREHTKLTSSGLPLAIIQQTELRPFIKQVLDNPSSAGIDALHKLMMKHGGPDGNFGGSIRAAVLDELIERSTIKGKAGGVGATEGLAPVAAHFVENSGRFDRISGKQFNSALRDFKERGLLKFLKPSDIKTAGDVEVIQKLMDVAAEDAGTALMGAATIKGVSQMSLDAIGDMIHYLGISRVLMSPLAIRIVAGSGSAVRHGIDTQQIQMIGSMFASLRSDVQGAQQVPELEHLINASQETAQ